MAKPYDQIPDRRAIIRRRALEEALAKLVNFTGPIFLETYPPVPSADFDFDSLPKAKGAAR